MLRIFGDEVPLRAQVEVLNGYSAHADRTELRRWLGGVKTESGARPPVWLVHGEPDAQDALAGQIREMGFTAEAPSAGVVKAL